jgi:sugar phosphate isomerase/epimerase
LHVEGHWGAAPLKTIRGPGLFIAQYLGQAPFFSDIDDVSGFAAQNGFKALQVPVHDKAIIDTERLEESGYIDSCCRAIERHGLVVSEIAAHRAGQLLAVHPVYDQIMDAFVPAPLRGAPDARQRYADQELRHAITLAARVGAGKLATLSGGLLWPFFYPYPPPPPGLTERGFAALAARWRPLLDHADKLGVDICFELHPGQDLHDGASFAAFLAQVDDHPRARLLYDPSHLRLQHLDYLGFIDRWHARIGAFHVKDAEFRPSPDRGVYGGYGDWIDRPGRFRSLGDGDIDFAGIFSSLTRYGYDGWAVLEWECCLKNAFDGAREGAHFIADHIILTTERGFDDGMRRSAPPDELDRMLGLKS